MIIVSRMRLCVTLHLNSSYSLVYTGYLHSELVIAGYVIWPA